MGSKFDPVDAAFFVAAALGGIGGLVFAVVNSLPRWAYVTSLLFFAMAASGLGLHRLIKKGSK